MKFINLNRADDSASFEQAVRRGLGAGQGLYFPEAIEPFRAVDELLGMPFHERSARVLARLTGRDEDELLEWLRRAFDFPLRQQPVGRRCHALELFHGPSLAFKDFGARFLAECLAAFSAGEPTTILTATSGDTGAAVAHAFHGQAGIRAVILYPKGRISPLQEKLFCTLGGNIHTIAVEADFDACQALVKQAFDDEALRSGLGLNSANSINVARLLAQVCYYFESVARLGAAPVFCVPSGNFGNVTACLLARAMGLPMTRVVAATNRNDTVPRYLESGDWRPRETIATLSNAMDISRPNNFPRVEALARRAGQAIDRFFESVAVSDEQTREAISRLHGEQGYLADPHSALAWLALDAGLDKRESGVFLCTAHPAKFADVIEAALGAPVPLPAALEAVRDRTVLSEVIPPEFAALKRALTGPMAQGQ